MKKSTKIKILSLMVSSLAFIGTKNNTNKYDQEFLERINDLEEGIYEYNGSYYEILYAPYNEENYKITYYSLDGYDLFSSYMIKKVELNNKQKVLELN